MIQIHGDNFDSIGKLISITIGICILFPLFIETILNLFDTLNNKKGDRDGKS